MSGRHQFQELTKDFAPERRRWIQVKKAELLAEMPLRELRQAMALTQQDLANRLQVNQPAVAKLEQRTDMYISSLRSYIESIGGQLRIVASFPAGDVTAMMGPGHLDQGLTLDVTGTNAFKMICRPDPRWPRQCRQPR